MTGHKKWAEIKAKAPGAPTPLPMWERALCLVLDSLTWCVDRFTRAISKR